MASANQETNDPIAPATASADCFGHNLSVKVHRNSDSPEVRRVALMVLADEIRAHADSLTEAA